MVISSRRSFLIGFGALIAAPAIVRASNIMPVRNMLILPEKISDITFPIEGFAQVGASQSLWTPSKSTARFIEHASDAKARIANFKNGAWEFTAEHPHNNPAIVTLRDGTKWQRRKGLMT